MGVKNSNKKKKIFWLVILIIVFVYIIFLLYSNLNLGAKREYVYYDSLNVNGNKIYYGSNIVSGAEPIFIKGNSKAVLLLHGLGGTPIEMKELANYLIERNLTVFVPLLDYQGRTYDEFKELDSEVVYEEALDYLNILKKNYSQVYVGGLSTGGSLSLKLAENNNVSGVISFAAPITYGFNFLGDSTIWIFKSLDFITPSLRRIEWGLSRNESIARTLPSFDRMPVGVLIQGELLKKDAKDNLFKINSPILILQSTFDNRAAPSSAQYIYDNVNSSIKKLVWLNNSGHVITMDYDKEKVFEETYEFIKEN